MINLRLPKLSLSVGTLLTRDHEVRLFAAVHEPAYGATRTCHNVRYPVAMEW
jgi:hypothetical protein